MIHANKVSLALVVLLSLVLSACTWPFAKKAGLSVSSQPQSEVILNGQVIGKTPLTLESVDPGTSTIRLVPTDTTLEAYETKINLVPGTKTVVSWDFGLSKTQSGGYSLSFEKNSSKDSAMLNVISYPNASSVTIDGKPEGFTPLQTESLSVGTHTVTVSSPGHQDRTVKVNLAAGFKTIVNFQLSMQQSILDLPDSPEATPSADATPSATTPITPTTPGAPTTPVATAPKPPYVEILDTPTGFLRVRATPSGTEVAQVKPGEMFPYVESTASGWFQITYATDKQGYISSQYAKLVR
jgi:uncharacterized protein YgiM (DUF1202 family)